MTIWSGAGMCPAFDTAFTVAAGPDGIRDRVPFSLPCSRHSPLVLGLSLFRFDRLSSDHQHLANSVATVVRLRGLVLCLAGYAATARKASPFVIMAQMTRAILLASATAATV